MSCAILAKVKEIPGGYGMMAYFCFLCPISGTIAYFCQEYSHSHIITKKGNAIV